MPHINRVRVNNVKYNFGTQYYDDFLMRFSCKNTIYDLANGGGKSVLMLLLLQNLIPNCTLDEKQPVEKLFRTSDGSKTIHSLIEWKLSDAHIKNNYKYMLTGFCARKAKDESGLHDISETDEGSVVQKENASIEYFNYVIFYREFNDNDIKNLPLSNGKERITYNGLKAYLRDLEKKDLSLEIKIFERKGDYQRFIAGYGLYESEWEIIRGINKTEGHVRTYFETNYKTTRKVVEDLLIEEIIQKSFNNQTESDGEEDYMATTLLNIKDKLLELSKKKEDINSFDRQIEVIDSFAKRVASIKQLYFGREDITESILKCYYNLKNLINKDEDAKINFAEREQALLEEKKLMESLIESAKISGKEKEALKLIEEIEQLINEQGLAAVDLKEANEELTLKESINDYADYMYYKNQRDELKEFMDASLKDKGQLLTEVTECTGVVWDRITRKQEAINEEIVKQEKILNMEAELNSNLSEEIEKSGEEIAVLSYIATDAKDKEAELNSKISAMKNELGLYMVADIKGELAKNKLKLEEAEALIKKNEDDIAKENENLNRISYELQNLSGQKSEVSNQLSENIDAKTNLSNLEAKEKKLLEIYGISKEEELAEDIIIRSREAVLEEESLSAMLSRKKKYLEQLKTGCPVGMSEAASTVMEYMERYYGGLVVYGAEYLKELAIEERKRILEEIPVLPYSIIVKKDYHTVISDGRLKELDLRDQAVPIISMEAINGSNAVMDNRAMMFVMGDGDLFIDEKLIEKELENTSADIDNISFRLERISKKVELLQQDYDFAKEYEAVYLAQIENVTEQFEKLRFNLRQIEADLEEKQKEMVETEGRIVELKEAKELLCGNASQLELEKESLNELWALMKQADELAGRGNEASIRLKKLTKEKADMEARYEAQLNQTAEREKQIVALKVQIEDNLKKLANYRKYYKEGNYNVSPMSDDELEARLNGLIGAMERDNSDLADKQKLMENYDIAMEKSLQAIDYKGLFVDDVKEKYEEMAKREISKEELNALKDRIKQIKAKVDAYVMNISKLKSSKDRLEGAIAHGKLAMEEKFGGYEAVEIENGDYDSFIEEKKALANGIENELQKVKEYLSRLQKNEGKYAVLEKDIAKIMDKAGIVASAQIPADDTVFSEEEFEEITGKVLEKFDKYTKDIADKKSEFEYERGLLADTLRKLGSESLADEIKHSAIMPANVSQTDELMDSLKDICKCLELEKERVGKSIDDMEKIKDNFENQCIQTCVNIKNELDRLPKQSKITMDDDVISIINLTVPYIKEDQYKFKMSQYIDETTQTADEMKTDSERIKYIKSRLSWKKLFSVIVTDMNAIKLNLYKRERIKEQSRYLKYEEAVGSTGQSQGIYIQFLIAIINYIASINSKDKEASLRKVIFIDNPFGAAKDIYIWEPIFKLLKTNNVQLVVPARGVTPAITGRFDVNYILGQKFVDGRQQTVVVDYSSHVDNEQMDYSKLEFEQATLF